MCLSDSICTLFSSSNKSYILIFQPGIRVVFNPRRHARHRAVYAVRAPVEEQRKRSHFRDQQAVLICIKSLWPGSRTLLDIVFSCPCFMMHAWSSVRTNHDSWWAYGEEPPDCGPSAHRDHAGAQLAPDAGLPVLPTADEATVVLPPPPTSVLPSPLPTTSMLPSPLSPTSVPCPLPPASAAPSTPLSESDFCFSRFFFSRSSAPWTR
jgi:hypothetical protein